MHEICFFLSFFRYCCRWKFTWSFAHYRLSRWLQPKKKNITSTEIHLIFIQSRAIVFSIIFFRSAILCYLFEFNRNSMDVKETVERSRDSMNPTEICCECDCVILFWVFFSADLSWNTHARIFGLGRVVKSCHTV